MYASLVMSRQNTNPHPDEKFFPDANTLGYLCDDQVEFGFLLPTPTPFTVADNNYKEVRIFLSNASTAM